VNSLSLPLVQKSPVRSLLVPLPFVIISSGVGFSAEIVNPSPGQLLAYLGLQIVALPVIMEVVFHGIVYKSLRRCWGVYPALAVSSVLFSYFWPLLAGYVAVPLSVVTWFLYEKTRSLIPGMIAGVLSLATIFVLARTFL